MRATNALRKKTSFHLHLFQSSDAMTTLCTTCPLRGPSNGNANIAAELSDDMSNVLPSNRTSAFWAELAKILSALCYTH
jgi:hypothetical protein